MGQRLNLGIRKKSKILANSYYHWSAYTGSAAELVDIAYNYLKTHSNESELLRAIHALEETGAGLEPEEFIYAGSRRDLCNKTFNKATDRNEGLMAISPKGIQDTEDWAEETAYIDIDDPENPKFYFWVVWSMDEDDFLEDYPDSQDDIVDYTFDPDDELDYSQLCQYVADLNDGKAVRYQGRIYKEIA